MIDPDPKLGPRIKLADFGFATDTTESASRKVSLGARLCMSPEMVRAEEHSLPVDIWAVGVFAYYLQSYGQYPFKGITKEVVNNKILNEEPEMHALDSAINQMAKDFIAKCLTKDVVSRPTVL